MEWSTCQSDTRRPKKIPSAGSAHWAQFFGQLCDRRSTAEAVALVVSDPPAGESGLPTDRACAQRHVECRSNASHVRHLPDEGSSGILAEPMALLTRAHSVLAPFRLESSRLNIRCAGS